MWAGEGGLQSLVAVCCPSLWPWAGICSRFPTWVLSLQARCKGSLEQGQPSLPEHRDLPALSKPCVCHGVCTSDTVEIIAMEWIVCHKGRTASKA